MSAHGCSVGVCSLVCVCLRALEHRCMQLNTAEGWLASARASMHAHAFGQANLTWVELPDHRARAQPCHVKRPPQPPHGSGPGPSSTKTDAQRLGQHGQQACSLKTSRTSHLHSGCRLWSTLAAACGALAAPGAATGCHLFILGPRCSWARTTGAGGTMGHHRWPRL